MHTSASVLPGSEGRRGGMPCRCHQYDTSPLRMEPPRRAVPRLVRNKLSGMVTRRAPFAGGYQVSASELTFSDHWQGSVKGMRLGVLDVGSNTVHLLVVDAYQGARPMPAFSHKVNLKLAAQLDGTSLSGPGEKGLRGVVEEALRIAEDKGVEEIIGVRDLGRPGSRERRAGAGPDPRADRGEDRRDDRRRGGAADLPRRPALVRLVLGAAAGDRHRRRLARGGVGHRRGAGRAGLAAARGRAPDQGLVQQRPALRPGSAAYAQARPGRDRPADRGDAAPRRPGPGGGHFEDVPAAGQDRGRRSVRRGPLRQALPAARRRGGAGRTAARDDPGRTGQAARGLRQPGRAAARRRHRGRRHPRPAGRRSARTMPVGPARGCHPATARHAHAGPGHLT